MENLNKHWQKIILLFFTSICFIACNESTNDKAIEVVKKSEITQTSLYNLKTDWTDNNKQKVKLEQNLGKYTVLAMVYTSCEYACPRIIEEMRRIESAIPKEKLKETKFLLVSIDPENDTPDAMAEFAKEENFDLKRWQLLSSNEDDTRELANLINFKYTKNDNGSYSHSNLIVLLDKNGDIMKEVEGFDNDFKEIGTLIK